MGTTSSLAEPSDKTDAAADDTDEPTEKAIEDNEKVHKTSTVAPMTPQQKAVWFSV